MSEAKDFLNTYTKDVEVVLIGAQAVIPVIGDILMSHDTTFKNPTGEEVYSLLLCNGNTFSVVDYPTLTEVLLSNTLPLILELDASTPYRIVGDLNE